MSNLNPSKILLLVTFTLLLFIPLFWLTSFLQERNCFSDLSSSLIGFVSSIKQKIGSDVVPDYRAEIVARSHESIRIKENEEVQFWIDFKNTGNKKWVNYGQKEFVALNVTDPVGRKSPFRNSLWDKDNDRFYYRPNRIDHREVPPGEIGRVRIILRAPKKPGDYLETFQLVSEWNQWISGSKFSIPITVDPLDAPPLPQNKGDQIKIGILETTGRPVEISGDGEFEIRGNHNDLLALYREGEVITIYYKDGKYFLEGPAIIDNKLDPRKWQKTYNLDRVYFVPKYDTILEIANFENRPKWNPALNDNRFRGKLVVWHSQKTNKTWVLNDLHMEEYVRGIAETSNSSHPEYQKALAIAARTYAQYIKNQGGKHSEDNFDLDSSSSDQVYKGYSFELRSPITVRSYNFTAGKMITYNDKIVVTPYFSRSDGRTRSWSEIWKGEKPWLVSVSDPYCSSMSLLGHGVGMSAYGALKMAENKFKYDEILKHYYTGIKIKKFY